MDVNDRVAEVARAAAERLAAETGDVRLPMEVERRLHGSAGGERGPVQYLDPVSLAELLVSITSLALAIYQQVRRHDDEPVAEVIERRVRVETVELPGIAALGPGQRDRIVSLVVEETIRHEHGG
jgi:hypothetical protein